MSVSVEIARYGRFSIPVTASSTAGDIMARLHERLPDQPWHGNKVLSYEDRQLRHDDVVMAAHRTLVLTNYSEISNKEIILVAHKSRFLGLRDLHINRIRRKHRNA